MNVTREVINDLWPLYSAGEASPDSDVTGHDWQYLLMKTHLLQKDTAIAHGCRVFATIVVIAGAIFALRLFYLMATLPKEAPAPPPDPPAAPLPPRIRLR